MLLALLYDVCVFPIATRGEQWCIPIDNNVIDSSNKNDHFRPVYNIIFITPTILNKYYLTQMILYERLLWLVTPARLIAHV